MLDGFKDSFREEAYDLLEHLESHLLELEENPEDSETISAVFRTMHTIKGSAGMFGFEAISTFTHEIETMLDDIRQGKLKADRNFIDLVLESRDHIRIMLDSPDDPGIDATSRDILEKLDNARKQAQTGLPPNVYEGELETSEIGFEGGRTGSSEADRSIPGRSGLDAAAPTGLTDTGSALRTFHIRFAPHEDFLSRGSNPILLLSELRELGECTVIPNTAAVPALDALINERAYTLWDIFLTTEHPRTAIEDVFIFAKGDCELLVRLIDEIDFADESVYKRLGQILVEHGVVKKDVVDKAVREQKRLGQVLVDLGIEEHEVEAALEEQEHVLKARRKVQADAAASSVRVHSDKLDDLVDLVGELVTLQARLSRTASVTESGALGTIAENFELLIGELRDKTMSIRMVPISSTFSRFRRLVRDLSRDLDKDIELVTEGGETELDKTVIERLHDPLVHIIRNSVDHGIESALERKRAGKPESAEITLTAKHVGARVVVSVSDNGAGLNREKILERAIVNGLVAPNQKISDSEIDDLIFRPGFSTAKEVTSVSGRGVGMDVVRREIEKVNGTVHVLSEPGSGTSVSLSIPLTLAIIDGLLVQIGSERFVIPLSAVQACIEMTAAQVRKGSIENRGALLPIVNLRKSFRIEGDAPPLVQAVVAETGEGPVGFVVDAVIGDHQTVIKNLGRLYQNVEGVSGATILGDGSVALILDVPKLAAQQIDEYTTTHR